MTATSEGGATLNWGGLVTRIRAGDDSAAVELVSTLGAQMDAYCATVAPDVSTLHREQAVERALQDVVRKIDKFDPERASLPTWSRAFVRNAIRDGRRRERELPQPASALDEWLEMSQARDRFTTGDFTDDAEKGRARQYQTALTRILKTIDPEDADLLYARAVEGLPYDVIAARFTSVTEAPSAAALRKRFQRTRERLLDAAAQDPHLKTMASPTPPPSGQPTELE